MTELTPIDRLTIRVEMVEQATRDLRGETMEIKRQWSQFIPLVSEQIGTKILSPWLSQNIKLPDSLDIDLLKGPLNMGDFPTLEQRRKGKG